MAKRILAFDIGTNSAGWAFIEENTRIIDLGVRIFEMGNRLDKDKEISRKGDRTTARGARRRRQRFLLRREQLIRLLDKNLMLPEISIKGEKSTQKTDPLLLFELRHKGLHEKITLPEIGKVFLYINKKRGFKSSRKEDVADDKETGKVKGAITELKKKIVDSNCLSVGEYFYYLKKAHRNGNRLDERILGNWIGRDMYEDEFDLIWEKQQEFYPLVLTNELYKEVKDRVIFFQRKLKSQKHLISKCRFEPSKRVAPKSSLAFQEFRLWQQLGNIRVSYGDRQYDKLSLEEKNKLAILALEKPAITLPAIVKELGFPKSNTEFNDVDEIKGLSTHSKLLKVIGPELLGYDEAKKNQLWHTLFFFDNTNKLKEYSIKAFGFDEAVAEGYSRISIEPDYGSISNKAIAKILPYLKKGFEYAEAAVLAGYHHSYNEEEEGKDRILFDLVPQLGPKDVRNPVVQKSVNECISIANDLIKLYGKPDLVKIELSRELKKPRQKREEERRKNREREVQRKMQAEFLTSTGIFKGEVSWKSSLVDKYQLWLELGCEDHSIEELRKFAQQMKKGDLDKYKLWLECNRISPYSGKPISLNRLFDGDIEIEHIVPYSKSLDNSFMNKTLSEYSINKEKGNTLPYEYYKNNPVEWEAFMKRVAHFPGPKKEKFLSKEIPADFLNSQLTNTGYIGKAFRQQLKKAIQTVEVRNGQATSILRRSWGLNSLLHNKPDSELTPAELEKQNIYKNRQDHRHHALDAVVIGCTTNRHIQLLSTSSQVGKYGKIENDEIEEPWRYFRAEVGGMLDKLFVSHNNRKRLVTSSINKYRHSQSKQAPQYSKAARGPLHEETFYGRILRPDTKERVFVSKKDVATIDVKQLDKVIDPVIREAIREHLSLKGKIDHDKNPLIITRMVNGQVKQVRVRKTRLEAWVKDMVTLRPDENLKLFVPTGSNFCIALYEGYKKGKLVRDYHSVPFLNAVQLSLAKQPLFPKQLFNQKSGETLDLLVVLKAKDMVVLYDQSEDEISWGDPYELFERLYYVINWGGTSGQIFLQKHHVQQEANTPKPIYISQKPSTFKGVKVKIDRLGKLHRL